METAKHPPKLSIVIPVYNTRKYLEECVASVYRQEYEPKEVILVNDGSTDGTSQLCDSLAQKYGLNVIHKQNGGISSARNAGIREASGKYIIFMDSDDYWIGDAGLLTRMIARLEEKDVKGNFIYFNHVMFSDGTNQYRNKAFEYDDTINAIQDKTMRIKRLFSSGRVFGNANMFIADIRTVKENDLWFDEKITVWEDVDWSIRLLKHANDFYVENGVLYAYRQNVTSSLSNTKTEVKFYTVMKIIDRYIDQYYTGHNRKNDDPSLYMLGYLCHLYCIRISNVRQYPKEYHKKFLKELKTRTHLFNYALHPVSVMIARMTKIFGIGVTSRLLYNYRMVRAKIAKTYSYEKDVYGGDRSRIF